MNTVSKLLKICFTYIRGRIIPDVLEAGKFSVQMDSRQDIAVQDQLTIVIRYVKSGIVHEHLYRFLRVEGSSTAASLYGMLKKELANDGLSIADVMAIPLMVLPTCQVPIGVSKLKFGKHHLIQFTFIVVPMC